MHVFIPGGAGYIGSILTPILLNSGYAVTIYDSCLQNEEVFYKVKSHPRLKLVKGFLSNLTLMEEALNGCETILYLGNTLETLEETPLESFLQIAKRKVANQFIYTSSFAVYENDASSLLSKFKTGLENILLQYKDDTFKCTLVSPETIYDQNIKKRETLEGYHLVSIKDLVGIYLQLLKKPLKSLQKQMANPSYQTHSLT